MALLALLQLLAGIGLVTWALLCLSAALYLLLLTLASGRLPALPPSRTQPRFDVVVPAHNEASVIRGCLHSLEQLEWPRERFRIWVIADNCDDATAALARDAGALVLERRHSTERGKGYALRVAFETSRDQAWADAVVVIDADSVVSPSLLQVFAAALDAGAPAVQALYGVRNPGATWRTGLMAIAWGAFHNLRSNARERLGLSCGLRGNGWCITHQSLGKVPYRAFSFIEDVEYGLALGLAGLRVHYAPQGLVLSDMERRASTALLQRRRWEGGRVALLRRQFAPLVLAAIKHRAAWRLDLVADLMVPPLSTLLLHLAALAMTSALLVGWLPGAPFGLAVAGGGGLVVLAYGLRGWQLSGRGPAGALDLLRVPSYLVWKLWHARSRLGAEVWAPLRRRRP